MEKGNIYQQHIDNHQSDRQPVTKALHMVLQYWPSAEKNSNFPYLAKHFLVHLL
jgi:hypothetical protein